MLVKISLIVSLCSGVSMEAVKAKLAEIQAHNPGSKVTLRLDKKCKTKGIDLPSASSEE